MMTIYHLGVMEHKISGINEYGRYRSDRTHTRSRPYDVGPHGKMAMPAHYINNMPVVPTRIPRLWVFLSKDTMRPRRVL